MLWAVGSRRVGASSAVQDTPPGAPRLPQCGKKAPRRTSGRRPSPWRRRRATRSQLPQAVPNPPVYVNIAPVFEQIGLKGTIAGAVLAHASGALALAAWTLLAMVGR